MATTDGHDTATERAHFCTNCGTETGAARFCPDCGTRTHREMPAVSAPEPDTAQLAANTTAPYEATTTTEFPAQPLPAQNATGAFGAAPPPAGPPPTRAEGGTHRSRVALIVAGAALGLVAIVVAVIIIATGGSGSSSNSNTVYKQKLTTALGPVVTANTALSNSLRDLSGSNTTPAKSALSQAEQAVTAARGAVAVLSVPQSSSQLEQQVQQALTQENGYLQAVGATLSTQSQGNISQVRPLGTSASSALVPLGSVAPGIGTSLNGSDQLISWANGRVAAAASAAAKKRKAAAKRPASSTSASSSGSSSSTAVSQGTDCGGGLHAGPATSCPFAENVQQAWDQAPAGVDTLQVFSPVTDQVYTMTCTTAGVGVSCTGGNNASVSW
jgi:hypothetical protein